MNRFYLAALFGFCLSTGLWAQRTELLLEKNWKFTKGDPSGAADLHFYDSKWTKVRVPHDWAIYGPFDRRNDLQQVAVTQNMETEASLKTGRTGGLPYAGIGWYRTTFSVNSGRQTTLIFDGAMSEAQVYVNGKEACRWPYGYNSFYCDVTPLLHADGKDNVLAVRLQNRPQSSRWYPGAGLYRNVHVVTTEKIHVPVWGTQLTTPYVTDEFASIRLRTEIVNAGNAELTVQTDILGPDGQIVTSQTNRGRIFHDQPFEQHFMVNHPQLWSPEQPSLYQAISKIYVDGKLQDTYTTRFGIRTLAYVADKGFYLNGRHRKFQGVCNHHDLGPLGAAINVSALRHQLQMLKDMGCDAVRTSHNMPARYGGFETLVENIIGENCSPEIQYTVFCSSKDMPQKLTSYRGAALRYVPLHANGVQSIPYDILSMIKTVGHGFDAMLVLGTSGCMFLPILRLFFRKKIIVNIDGLEHRRAKWGKMAKRYLRMSEAVAVKMADVIVADNQGIAQYVKEKYGFQPSVIAYGGDHVLMNLSEDRQCELLKTYGVEPGKYAVTVCRIEPENNSRMILETFTAQKDMKLVFVGNWEKSDYSRSLREEFGKYSHICLVNSEYNLDRLYALRSQCAFYIHGHSAGGTNPSLVEAMWLGCPVLAYDVVYNRYTTGNRARYFHNSDELAALLQVSEAERKRIGRDLRQLAEEEYHWKRIAEQYEAEY